MCKFAFSEIPQPKIVEKRIEPLGQGEKKELIRYKRIPHTDDWVIDGTISPEVGKKLREALKGSCFFDSADFWFDFDYIEIKICNQRNRR
jgi:hypothetical protein